MTGKPNQHTWARFWMLACLLGATACSYAPDRYHPDYQAYRQSIRRVLMLPPEISIVEESANGTAVWQLDMSRAARDHADDAVRAILAAKHYSVQMVDPAFLTAGPERAEIETIQTLYRSVNRSIQLHTYGPQLFPAKRRRFDYGIGPVSGLLRSHDADALVLVMGHQTLSREQPRTWISIAVVAPDGTVIWYGMQGSLENLHLEDPGGALTLVRQTLQPFGGGAS
jgi:hypothetical protein